MDAGGESMPLTGVAGEDIAESEESHGKHENDVGNTEEMQRKHNW